MLRFMEILNKIRHVGIVVNDIDGAVSFWTKILGMKIISDQVEKGPIIDAVLGLVNVYVRTVKMVDKQNGIVELLRFANPENSPRKNAEPNSTGITHIALEVLALEENREKLEKAGVRFFGPIQLSSDKKVKVMYARGPEDILLEFVEVL